jgi:formate--tetrahydrofolate ligase
MSVPSDLAIAQAAHLEPIEAIAAKLGLAAGDLDRNGDFIAKIRLDAINRLQADRPLGRYILVTAITPTPLGEGKTTTTVGLTQALNQIGKRAVLAIRQPSMGPTFGIKGGAAGGGYSQVVPMSDFNLHLTGDIHAVTAANNLLAAMIDNHLYHGNALGIDPYAITWKRVLDVSDRVLRNVTVGLGARGDGPPRQTGFDIAVASEVMAILALTTSLRDLRERMGRIVFGYSRDGKPITAEDLKAAGAMTVLMKDALKPTLVQTLEGGPALVHAGPFANIAHGNSSILADLVGTRGAEYCVTEAGFGADIGAEKFFNIKCRASGLQPDAAVLVTTVRAMKLHSGKHKVTPGKPLPEAMLAENVEDVLAGCSNLAKQVANLQRHGVTPVVCINHFASDHASEVEAIQRFAAQLGVRSAVSRHWAHGGAGAEELARAVVEAAEEPSTFKALYELDQPVKSKIHTIAREIYGADEVEYSAEADKQIARYEQAGLGGLPICMAKTHLSLSDDPKKLGAPMGFSVFVRDVRASAGAGFLSPLLGEMRTMPGLPSHPAAENVDIDLETGEIKGLF